VNKSNNIRMANPSRSRNIKRYRSSKWRGAVSLVLTQKAGCRYFGSASNYQQSPQDKCWDSSRFN